MATRTVEAHWERKAGFFTHMVNALWRACLLIPSGVFFPGGAAFRHCAALSSEEKAELEAYLAGLE
jgi:hypothetical protein